MRLSRICGLSMVAKKIRRFYGIETREGLHEYISRYFDEDTDRFLDDFKKFPGVGMVSIRDMEKFFESFNWKGDGRKFLELSEVPTIVLIEELARREKEKKKK